MGALTRAGPATPARTGVWVGIAAITMMFAAFTAAMVVRQSETDWYHFRLPPILYFNTLVLLVSSGTLERSRSGLAAAPERESRGAVPGTHWLSITLGLGVLFVLGQVLAWRNLAEQGLFLATSPSSAFFYVFTALHGTHVLGGLAALGYVLHRATRARGVGSAPVGTADAASAYWHFLTGLWLYLLVLLTLRL